MATTPLILADGTFSCVLPGYTQLYIFHVVVANNVSVPALFCLVRGKDKETYTTLLRLVEGIAQRDGTRFFNRPVTVMCDFDDAFIGAVQEHYESVNVKCCFFHFVKNIREKANRIITRIKKAVGQRSLIVQLAEKTKRRLMILPLLPEEAIICSPMKAWTSSSLATRRHIPTCQQRH